MPNVSLQPADRVTLDDLFADIKRGPTLSAAAYKSIDQQRHSFNSAAGDSRNPRWQLGAMVKDAAYQSRASDFWESCDGVGGPATYRLWDTAADGKGEPGQTNQVSHGCPPARFRNITVLNTAAV